MTGYGELPNYLDGLHENTGDFPTPTEPFGGYAPFDVDGGLLIAPTPVAEPPAAVPAPQAPEEFVPEGPEDAAPEAPEAPQDFVPQAPEDAAPDNGPELDPTPAEPNATDTDPMEVAPVASPDDVDVPSLLPDDEPIVLDDQFFAEDGVAGNHFPWSLNWFSQEINGYCGPTSVAIVLNQFLGAGINNPEYMVEQAQLLNLMGDPSMGMHTDDIATLLTSFGVQAHVTTSSIEDLAVKLEMGYGVIACVDSGEIWHDDPADDQFEDNTSDHALVVSEIDFNNGIVTLADPGEPDGSIETVSIAEFEDAWADSGFEMVVTDDPDPKLVDPAFADRHMAIVNATRSETIR